MKLVVHGEGDCGGDRVSGELVVSGGGDSGDDRVSGLDGYPWWW